MRLIFQLRYTVCILYILCLHLPAFTQQTDRIVQKPDSLVKNAKNIFLNELKDTKRVVPGEGPGIGYFGLSMPLISEYGCHLISVANDLHKSYTMIVIFCY